MYRTYNTDGTALLFDQENGWDCTWPANNWITVMTVTVTGNTGCTTFQITNNGSGQPSNTNFYLSLGGIEKQGAIEGTPVQI
ncbi:MAG TPA: hypothetical protein PK156_28705, partial [Polyangium sp.]|nr:hypothetical protein [Polyangium sp.]